MKEEELTAYKSRFGELENKIVMGSFQSILNTDRKSCEQIKMDSVVM